MEERFIGDQLADKVHATHWWSGLKQAVPGDLWRGIRGAGVWFEQALFYPTNLKVVIAEQPCTFRVNGPIEASRVDEGLLGEREYFERIIGGIEKDDEKIIVNAGAYIGTLAIPLAKRFPERMIAAIEPDPDNFSHLQQNIGLNNLHNLYAYNAAVTIHSGNIALQTSGTEGTAPRVIELTSSRPAQNLFGRIVTVIGMRLDGLFRPDTIGSLIMDVEGHELLALEGLGQLRPDNLFVEGHRFMGVTPELLDSKTGELGYQLLWRGFREGGSFFNHYGFNK